MKKKPLPRACCRCSHCATTVKSSLSMPETHRLIIPHAHLADKIISSAKGRARQMNLGASHASGDILIFLHADTYSARQRLATDRTTSRRQAMGPLRHSIKRRSFHVKSNRLDDEPPLPPDRHCHRRPSDFCYAGSVCSGRANTLKSP